MILFGPISSEIGAIRMVWSADGAGFCPGLVWPKLVCPRLAWVVTAARPILPAPNSRSRRVKRVSRSEDGPAGSRRGRSNETVIYFLLGRAKQNIRLPYRLPNPVVKPRDVYRLIPDAVSPNSEASIWHRLVARDV